jgi:hypothetical protein
VKVSKWRRKFNTNHVILRAIFGIVLTSHFVRYIGVVVDVSAVVASFGGGVVRELQGPLSVLLMNGRSDAVAVTHISSSWNVSARCIVMVFICWGLSSNDKKNNYYYLEIRSNDKKRFCCVTFTFCVL